MIQKQDIHLKISSKPIIQRVFLLIRLKCETLNTSQKPQKELTIEKQPFGACDPNMAS
jgi:hypothetical protein